MCANRRIHMDACTAAVADDCACEVARVKICRLGWLWFGGAAR